MITANATADRREGHAAPPERIPQDAITRGSSQNKNHEFAQPAPHSGPALQCYDPAVQTLVVRRAIHGEAVKAFAERFRVPAAHMCFAGALVAPSLEHGEMVLPDTLESASNRTLPDSFRDVSERAEHLSLGAPWPVTSMCVTTSTEPADAAWPEPPAIRCATVHRRDRRAAASVSRGTVSYAEARDGPSTHRRATVRQRRSARGGRFAETRRRPCCRRPAGWHLGSSPVAQPLPCRRQALLPGRDHGPGSVGRGRWCGLRGLTCRGSRSSWSRSSWTPRRPTAAPRPPPARFGIGDSPSPV